MKTKKAFIFAVLVLMQFCVAFGQYVQNFQAVYPVNSGYLSSSNYTLAKGLMPDSGYMLATNTDILNTTSRLLSIKLDNNFAIQFQKSYNFIFRKRIVSVETKDAIRTTDNEGYTICGNILYLQDHYGFIVRLDRNLTPLWGKVYYTVNYLNSITEIISGTSSPKYIAVGSSNINPAGTANIHGVILCLDAMGNPIWENNTNPVAITVTDQYIYNQVIPVNIPGSKYPDFAIVGNTITTPYNDKNIIVTRVDINGNNKFSMIYGLVNDTLNTFDEEGYGICKTEIDDQIIICGRSKYIYKNQFKWDDLLLFSINQNSGNVNWANRYDFPSSFFQSPIYPQSIITLHQQELYVNGYYKSVVFTPNGSIDAFLFQGDIYGNPKNLKTFGDLGEDRLYRLMENNKRDGITNAGYSSSYLTLPTTPSFSPYVVESYPVVNQKCHDLKEQTPFYQTMLPIRTLNFILVQTKLESLTFDLAGMKSSENVICNKIPFPKDASVENNVSKEIKIYPTICNSSIKVSGAFGNAVYSIYSQTGTLLNTGIFNNSIEIDVSKLSTGMYFISINNNGKFTNVKFIKE